MALAARVITLVRTLNEERNIDRFISQYSKISNKILVSDGGSTDKTLDKIARWQSKGVNVEVRPFDEKIPANNKMGFYTHEPKQINALINWGKEERADWLIYDDCDCWPNIHLINFAPEIFNAEICRRIMIYRLYVYKGRWYFPDMNKPGFSLWAWQPEHCAVYCREEEPRESGMVQDVHVVTYYMDHPRVLLHNFAQSEKHITEKKAWYESKKQPQLHPKDGCGKLVKLPEWAHI